MSGLRKPKEYDWKDSNMALFGSDTDKKVKKESAETEPAWRAAGAEVGVKVWRINKFKVEHWPEDDYGKFFSGDSYIVLNTFEEDSELKFDVHFWIGKYSTQDEYGTAAYKTVELDTYLDDKPIQHREVQGHESPRFLSYFDTMVVMKGGCDSGFRRVEPEAYTPRLFHIEKLASKKIVSREVAMKRGNLQSDDVFIIDNGLTIYQWNGKQCSADEKFKGAMMVKQLMSSRNGRSRVEVVEEASSGSNHPALMLLKDGASKPKKEAVALEPQMMKVSDESGSLEMTEVMSGKLDRSMLSPEDVFIINTGVRVFTWVGGMASIDERKNGLSYAASYLNKTENPCMPISVLVQGRESQEFLSAF